MRSSKPIQLESLLGKTESEAIKQLKAARYSNFRVFDEKSMCVTLDYDPTRLNLAVENGVVARVYMG